MLTLHVEPCRSPGNGATGFWGVRRENGHPLAAYDWILTDCESRRAALDCIRRLGQPAMVIVHRAELHADGSYHERRRFHYDPGPEETSDQLTLSVSTRPGFDGRSRGGTGSTGGDLWGVHDGSRWTGAGYDSQPRALAAARNLARSAAARGCTTVIVVRRVDGSERRRFTYLAEPQRTQATG